METNMDRGHFNTHQLPQMIPTNLGDYDLSKFDIHFFVDVEPQKVFLAWATTQGLESFFIQKATYNNGASQRSPAEIVQAGDKYQWNWPNGNSLEGHVLLIRDNAEIAFTFGNPGKLTVFITPEDKGTKIHLVQSEIPVTYHDLVHTHINCRGAWIHFLTCLKAKLESDAEARELKPHLSSSLATAYDFRIRRQ